MIDSIKIGPIQRQKQENCITAKLRKNVTTMKVGNYFEVSGPGVTRSSVNSIRATLSYIQKRDKVGVKTSFKNGILTVTRVRKEN